MSPCNLYLIKYKNNYNLNLRICLSKDKNDTISPIFF